MPREDYKTCRECGRHADEVGPLSHSRLCSACGEAVLVDNVIGLHTHTGLALLRWRRGMVEACGGVLMADLEAALLDAEQAAT